MRAGGVGLTLTGASRLVLFEPSWNPADDDQAVARVWRDGQKRPVFVYRFATCQSIEERVLDRQRAKRALARDVRHCQRAEALLETAVLEKAFDDDRAKADDAHTLLKLDAPTPTHPCALFPTRPDDEARAKRDAALAAAYDAATADGSRLLKNVHYLPDRFPTPPPHCQHHSGQRETPGPGGAEPAGV